MERHDLFQVGEQGGVRSFGRGKGPDGKEMRAVNVRCLDGVSLEGLKLYPFDGKSL